MKKLLLIIVFTLISCSNEKAISPNKNDQPLEIINLHPNSSIGKILKAVCHSWKNGVRVSY